MRSSDRPSTRYVVETAIRLSKEPGTWEKKLNEFIHMRNIIKEKRRRTRGR